MNFLTVVILILLIIIALTVKLKRLQRMNTNPITAKLQKMFGRKKKPQLTMPSTLHQSHNLSSLNISAVSAVDESLNTSMAPLSSFKEQNKENIEQSQNFNTAMVELEQMKAQLSHYKKVTKKLQQKISDHQLLQEFYLQQLKQRDEVQKELKWKLEIISEEIKSNRLSLYSARDLDSSSSSFFEKAMSTQY